MHLVALQSVHFGIHLVQSILVTTETTFCWFDEHHYVGEAVKVEHIGFNLLEEST